MEQKEKINLKAIFYGWLFDFGGSSLSSITISFALAYFFILRALSLSEFIKYTQSLKFLIISILISIIFSYGGGYISAKVAGFKELTHAFITGIFLYKD